MIASCMVVDSVKWWDAPQCLTTLYINMLTVSMVAISVFVVWINHVIWSYIYKKLTIACVGAIRTWLKTYVFYNYVICRPAGRQTNVHESSVVIIEFSSLTRVEFTLLAFICNAVEIWESSLVLQLKSPADTNDVHGGKSAILYPLSQLPNTWNGIL